MKKLLLSLGVLSVMGLAQPAAAEIEQYTLEKPHSQILFFVNHLGFSHSSGRFLDFDGNIEFNRSEPEKSSVDVTIKTDSLEMNDQKWNDHLKGDDFFKVASFPTMTFKSTGIEVTGEDTGLITGDLTMLGVTKPVTLDVKFNKAGKHPFGNQYAAGFSATADIKRSDFGMNYGLPAVGDEVEIRIEVEAIREETEGESASNK